MKTVAVLLIAFISVTSGLQMFEKYGALMNFSSKRSIMAVFAQVEAALKNGGPMDAITRVLQEYEDEIRAEQLAHDQLYARQTAECNGEFEFRTGEVEEADAALKEGTETLDGCKQQQVRAKEDLRITKKQLKEKTAELINVHTTRKREKYKYDTSVGVFQILNPAIDEALEYLEQLFAGEGSFIQMSRHTNKMLISAVQLRQSRHMSAILAVLSQVAAESEDVNADQALLNKLQNLFTNFQAKIQAAHAAAVEAEDAAIAKYNADVTRIEGIIANLEDQQAGLENEISELDKCIITQQNIIAAATQKKDRNQRLYDDAIKMCAAMDRQYAAAKVGRAAELELLAAITVKVEEHFAQITHGVTARGEMDDFDSTYENDTAYDNAKFQAS